MSSSTKPNKSLIVLMVNMFIAMLGIGLVIPILPKLLEDFNAGGTAAGYLIAASGLTQFLFSPLAGEWSDKYGRKRMIVLGLLLFTLSQFLFAIANVMWMLYISRFLGGIGAAMMVPAMMAYVADSTTEDTRGKGLGMLGAAMSLGFVIGPGIGGFLADFGLRAPFYISALIAAIATVLSFFMLKETLSEERLQAARQSQQKRESIVKQLITSVKAPYFIYLILVFTLTFGLVNFEAVFSLYVDNKYAYTTKEISIMITVGALVGVVIQGAFINKLLHRFGENKLINVSFLISAIAMVLMLLSGNFWYNLLLILIFFTFTSIMRPAINTVLSKMAGNEEQGFVMGMNNAYMSLGNIFGPALAGILFDVHVNLPYSFGAIILVLSLILSVSWGKRMTGRSKQKLEAAS
ncbi:tetracycline resistance MFS efflux pump [Paenibacillus sp. J23TS9]|uniref:MFS transporter n=1 Tax=Paenibacillus sp. J23TS9 TaxID=2807193 RepID=UPI001B2AB042|nr:MFS transporter [Paenibacillus sp. J23TS9]GIP29998.1 tetracycline resistance MFS efflux pump [Paenibacillus sp. J23TS9]